MTAYNRETQVNIIIHFFIVPFIITIISSVGICIIHCNCSCKKERPKYRRPRIDNLRWAFFFVCSSSMLHIFVCFTAALVGNFILFFWHFVNNFFFVVINVAVTPTLTFNIYLFAAYRLFLFCSARKLVYLYLLLNKHFQLTKNLIFILLLNKTYKPTINLV